MLIGPIQWPCTPLLPGHVLESSTGLQGRRALQSRSTLRLVGVVLRMCSSL